MSDKINFDFDPDWKPTVAQPQAGGEIGGVDFDYDPDFKMPSAMSRIAKGLGLSGGDYDESSMGGQMITPTEAAQNSKEYAKQEQAEFNKKYAQRVREQALKDRGLASEDMAAIGDSVDLSEDELKAASKRLGYEGMNRNVQQIAGDTALSGVAGVKQLAKAGVDLFYPEGETAQYLNESIAETNSRMSPEMREQLEWYRQQIKDAESQGRGAEFVEAFGNLSPQLAAHYTANTLPSMVPVLAAGKVAQGLATARGATAAGAALAGARGAGVANAALNAGGARGDAFEELKQTYISKGATEDQAIELALSDSWLPAGVGAVTGYIGGRFGAESDIIRDSVTTAAKFGLLPALKAVLGSLGRELTTEQAEELLPKITTNLLAEKDPLDGVAEISAQTFAGSVGMGSVGAASAGRAAYQNPLERELQGFADAVDETNFNPAGATAEARRAAAGVQPLSLSDMAELQARSNQPPAPNPAAGPTPGQDVAADEDGDEVAPVPPEVTGQPPRADIDQDELLNQINALTQPPEIEQQPNSPLTNAANQAQGVQQAAELAKIRQELVNAVTGDQNAAEFEQMAQEAAQAGNAQANAVQIAAQIEAAQSVNDLQQTLRGIESDELVSTLVQYPALTDKVMGAMSPGARQMLSDDLAKVADVEQAAAPQGEVAGDPPAKVEFVPAKVEDSRGRPNDGFRAEFDNTNGGKGYIDLAVDGDRIYPTMVDNGLFRPTETTGGAVRKAYEDAIEFAESKGLRFTSDDSVTVGAARVYDSLQKRGYEVAKNPAARLATSPEVITDRWMTDDGSPVFTVSKSGAAPAAQQPPVAAPQPPTTAPVSKPISERETPQLIQLAKHGLPGKKEEAIAELARRGVTVERPNEEPPEQRADSNQVPDAPVEVKPEAVNPAQGSSTIRSNTSPIQRRDDLVGAIMRVTGGKGIAANMAQTIVGDTANNATKVRGLFTNAGTMDLDDTADLLRNEEGFDVRDGNHLAELIREQAAGNPVYSMERIEREAAKDADRKHREEVLRRAKKYGVRHVARPFAETEAEVFRIMEERHVKAVQLLDDRSFTRFSAMLDAAQRVVSYEDLDAIVTDAHNRFEGRKVWDEARKQIRAHINDLVQAEKLKRQESQNAIEIEGQPDSEPDWISDGQPIEGPGSGSAVDRINEAGEGQATPEGSGGSQEEFSLVAQSDDDVRAQEQQREDADSDRLTKEQIDRERDAVPFSLSQQSQPKPQGVQVDMIAADGRISANAVQPADQPRAEPVTAQDQTAQATEAARYLKDFVYSLDQLDGVTDRVQVALSNEFGKSGRDSMLMKAFGITRDQAHDINNRLDSSVPRKLRKIDMQEAFDIFKDLRGTIDAAIKAEAESAAKKAEAARPPKDQGAAAFKSGAERNAPEGLSIADKARWLGGYDEAKAAADQEPAKNEAAVGAQSTGQNAEPSAVDAENEAETGAKWEEAKSPIDLLGDPPTLDYRTSRQASNSIKILPPVGKRFSDQDLQSLLDWVKAAGFTAWKKDSGLYVVGDNAPDIPDGLEVRRIEKKAKADAERESKAKAEADARYAEYRALPSSAWIESTLGGDGFANAYNRLMLARFLDGKDSFKGLSSQGWLDPLARLGFPQDLRTSSVAMADVLSFLKQKYEDSKALPKREELQARIEAAEQQTNHDATPAQKEAGNYAKGKFTWNSLTVSVETAKGEDRTDKETNGDKWRVTMPATYGYILGTKGADKDHVDLFMGDNPESESVFVVNQNQVDSQKFDEHKVMAGFASAKDAQAAYMASFEDGFGDRVFGSITGPYSIKEFREMLDAGKFEKPQSIGTPISPLSMIDVQIDGETMSAEQAIQDIDDQLSLADMLLNCVTK